MGAGQTAGKFIGLVIGFIIAISLAPTVADIITATNTSTWSALTGGAGAIVLLEIALLVFMGAVILSMVKEALSD